MFGRIARADQNVQLEKLFGAVEFTDRPMLEVKLPTAEPEAFEMILNYIYTDKIDCKCLKYIEGFLHSNQSIFFVSFSSQHSTQQSHRHFNDGHLPTSRAVLDTTIGTSCYPVPGIQDFKTKRLGCIV